MDDFSKRFLAARSDEGRRACVNAETKRVSEENGFKPGVSWEDAKGIYMPIIWSEHLSRNLSMLMELQKVLEAYSDYDGPLFVRTPGDDPDEPVFVLRRDTPRELLRKAEYVTEAVKAWAASQGNAS